MLSWRSIDNVEYNHNEDEDDHDSEDDEDEDDHDDQDLCADHRPVQASNSPFSATNPHLINIT